MSDDMQVQAAAIQWARTAMQSGSNAACLESAVRVASLGVLDKGAETREAGTALMLVLAQVGSSSHWRCVLRILCLIPCLMLSLSGKNSGRRHNLGLHIAGAWQRAHHSRYFSPHRTCQEGSQ